MTHEEKIQKAKTEAKRIAREATLTEDADLVVIEDGEIICGYDVQDFGDLTGEGFSQLFDEIFTHVNSNPESVFKLQNV